MKNVSDILENIKDQLPQYAAPVAKEMLDQVSYAREKVDKYEARSKANAAWHARAESVCHRGFPPSLLHWALDAPILTFLLCGHRLCKTRALLHNCHGNRSEARVDGFGAQI